MIKFIWILIPLAGIALAGFSEWLKFKRSTASLGESTSELAATIEALKAEIEEMHQERLRLVHRIQNLETIITSEAWDTLGTDSQLAGASLPELPAKEDDDEQRASEMARRIRGT